MLWATYRADPWTRKSLDNGLTPEMAAKCGNALQKYVMENTRLGIPLFLAEEAPHGHMAIGTTVFPTDRKSTRLNSSHANISYAVFCLKKKKKQHHLTHKMNCVTYHLSLYP